MKYELDVTWTGGIVIDFVNSEKGDRYLNCVLRANMGPKSGLSLRGMVRFVMPCMWTPEADMTFSHNLRIKRYYSYG